jgi:hypothetical protein
VPFDVEEGETGVPEEQVRLDEVLVEIGDRLFYTYDFGDDWQHSIRLEAILVPRGFRTASGLYRRAAAGTRRGLRRCLRL